VSIPGQRRPEPERPHFDMVLRGYDRIEVDEYIEKLLEENAALRREVEVGGARSAPVERPVEREDPSPQHYDVDTPAEDSFGFRAEKLLRMAEQEAVEIRSNASRESASIIEQARKEAEQHRHEVEQTLISRASLLEQQAAQRSSEIQEREQQVADQLAAAREQADQMHAAATRAADRLRQESEAAAEETRARAEAAAQRQRDSASQEIARLSALQQDVRSELARLAEVLTNELAADSSRGGGARRGLPTDSLGEKETASVSNGRSR
jgi:DivIVA domain-containing protein